MPGPELTVIVINWNTCGLLRDCLRSVTAGDAQEEHAIIVVDNGSTDGSAEMVEREFPQVRLLRNLENLGFAKANNQALRMASTPYACLLNSDVVVPVNTLKGMVDYMESNRECAACAPALRLPSGLLQTGAAGYELTPLTFFNYFFFLSRFWPQRFRGIYLDQKSAVFRGQPVVVDWLAGACLMVRTSVLKQAGLLDESIFLYSEDVEWCSRLRQNGEVHYLPDREVLHHHGGSSDSVSVQWLYATFAYLRTRLTETEVFLCRSIAAVGFALRLIGYTAGGILRRDYSKKAKAMRRYLIFTISNR